MGLDDKARELAGLIKSTSEFKELKQVKSVVDRNRNLKSEIEEFNRRQASLLSGKYQGDAEAGMRDLGKKYESMSKIPEIDRYLRAARTFNDLLSTVFKTINDTISDGLK